MLKRRTLGFRVFILILAWSCSQFAVLFVYYIAGYPKQAHSHAGSFCKKYLGYEHSETCYRRIFFIPKWRFFIPASQRAKKKKNEKKLFVPYKIIDSENFIKVSQNPNKVARDTQGLPTVPHNDFGGLNFKDLASKYLLLMATSPYKVTFFLKKP